MKKIGYFSILLLLLSLFSNNKSFASDNDADCSIAVVTSDYAACNATINLVGILSGSSTSGIWTVVGGAGTLGSSSTAFSTVSAMYTVDSGDAGNTLTFRLTASGGCTDAFKELDIIIENGSTAVAGIDFETCISPSLLSPIPVSGTIGAGASSGNWSISSGSGTLSASINTFPGVTADYTPTLADIAVGFVELTLTTDDPDGAGPCNPATDIVKITLSLAATASAGTDFSSCGINTINLSGTIGDGATTGSWSVVTGGGIITPIGGAFPIFTANYSPTLADIGQTVTFRFTATAGGSACPVVFDDIDVAISAEATAAAGVDSETCINANAIAPITVSGVIGGAAASGHWNITTGSGSLSPSINAYPNVTTDYTPTLADIALGYVELTLTTDPSGICNVVDDMIKISLSLAPTADAGSGFTICESTPINLSGTIGDGANTGSWSILTGDGVLTNTGGAFPNVTADYTPTVADATTGFVEFTLTTDDPDGVGSCSAANDVVKINITKNPSAAIVGIDNIVCASNYANLGGNTPTIGSGVWATITGGGVVSNSTNPTTGVTNLSVGVNTFRWTISNGICSSTFDEITITRNDVPTTANAGADINMCDMTSGTLSANTPTVGTGIWTVITGTGIVTVPSSSITGVTSLSTGINTFRWTISNGSCTSASDDITITLNTKPVITFNTIPAACLSSGKTILDQASPTGGVYSGIGVNETFVGSGIYEFDSDALGVIVGLNTITYSYTDLLTGCSNTANRTIQIRENPVLTQDGFADFCVNDSPIIISGGKANGIELITIPGATYTYSGPGVTDLGAGIFRFDPVAAGAGTHSITLTFTDTNGCNATQVTTEVTVNSLPEANAIVGKAKLCIGETMVKYEVTAHAGALYNWDVVDIIDAGGVIISGGGFNTPNSSVTVSFGLTPFVGNISMSESINGCEGNSMTLSITTFSQVVADAGIDHTLCNGENVTIGGTPTATGGSADYTYLWTPSTGLNDATIANPTATPNTTTSYTVAVTDNISGCTVATDEVVITINPMPLVTIADIATMCGESGKYALTEGSPTGGVYSGIGVSETTTGSGIYEFDPSAAGAGTFDINYTYTNSDSPCQATATTSINVEICTGIEDELLETFSLYPNPSAGHLTINGLVNESELVSVAVYDKLGKVVYQTQAAGKKLGQGIDLGKLTKGIYFVKLRSEKTEYQLQKLVIQ